MAQGLNLPISLKTLINKKAETKCPAKYPFQLQYQIQSAYESEKFIKLNRK